MWLCHQVTVVRLSYTACGNQGAGTCVILPSTLAKREVTDVAESQRTSCKWKPIKMAAAERCPQ
jgi:hypothetical protein